MTRRVLNLLTALSLLLLCVAVCVLWLRSHWRVDVVESFWPTGALVQGYPRTRGVEAHSVRGVFMVQFTGNSLNTGGQSRLAYRTYDPIHSASDEFPRGPFPGVAAYSQPGLVCVFVRHIWVLAAALVPSALWLVRLLRRRRRSTAGLCASCGYDLRATPGRCPECGSRREGA